MLFRYPLLCSVLAVVASFVSPQIAWSQLKAESLTGLVIDDTKAKFKGEWKSSTSVKPFLGESYVHDSQEGKGEKSAEFEFQVKSAGEYAVLVAYTPGGNRDKAVPITIHTADGVKTVELNQSQKPELGTGFQTVGMFRFDPAEKARLLIETKGTTAHVIVDGIRLLSKEELAKARQTEKTAPKVVAKVEKKAEKPKPKPPTFKRRVLADLPKTIGPADLDALFAELSDPNPPAPLVDDIGFLRRVSLDLVGRQPTLEEFRQYLKDQSSQRRAHAVERLLDSPDFGKNWGNFWSDVIAARQEEPQLTFLNYKPFRAWLADRLNAGTGWDEIVFQMLTAIGSVGDYPQGTFIGFHQGEPNKLAGETTRVFLSTKIACAQCHDHPFIEMPQETFHGFAAFFARTKVKLPWNDSNGIVISSSDKGEHKMPGGKKAMAPTVLNADPVDISLGDLQRRERLAYWVVDGENPYFARAFVNHVWARLLGRGFYDPVDDMGEMADGKLTELHDALAGHFVRTGFQPKEVFRLIANSRIYQEAERPEPVSPFTGAVTKKLRGDEVFDSLAIAIELPNLKGEPEKASSAVRFPPPPKSTRDLVNAAFGYDPSFQDSLITRTMKQAMLLMNNAQVLDQIKADPKSETMLAKLVAAEPDDDVVIDVLYARVLARKPSDKEREIVESHLGRAGNRKTAYEDLLWSLVNSAEFTTRN